MVFPKVTSITEVIRRIDKDVGYIKAFYKSKGASRFSNTVSKVYMDDNVPKIRANVMAYLVDSSMISLTVVYHVDEPEEQHRVLHELIPDLADFISTMRQ